MRLIEEAEIRAAVSVSAARTAVYDAFCSLADGKVVAPHELAMRLDHGGELHIKGAYLGGDVIAFKAATGQFPSGGNSGFTAVLDAETGVPRAILQDGGWLTEMRTAAASAVTARALAREDSSTLAILGGGIQAGFQVAALREAFAIETVNVWSRSVETAERFGREHDAQPIMSVADAVAEADIVVTCTPARDPLLARHMISPGTHVIAMGADMVGKNELGTDLVSAADRYVCDAIAVCIEVGELQHVPAIRATAVDLGDVLTGRSPGRTEQDQITIADLCGLGIQDAAMAQLVLGELDG